MHMQTHEIPKEQWTAYLNTFSRVHLGRRVRLWVAGPDTGICKEAVNLPLVGIAVERPRVGGGVGERIDVIVGDSPSAHVTREIRRPSSVRVATTENGEGQTASLQIDSEDGTSTYLVVREAGAR